MSHRSLAAIAFAVVLALSGASARAEGFSPQLSPEARASLERGERALAEQDFPTAARELERVIELAPDYPGVYVMYTASLTGESRKAAIDRYTKLTKEQPTRAAYWYGLGRISPDPVVRQAAFDKVVELDPKGPWGYFGLGSVARSRNLQDKALLLYEKALSIAPSEPSILVGAIGAFGSVPERRAQAIKLLDELLKIAPGSFHADLAFSTLLQTVDEADAGPLAERYRATFPSGMGAPYAYYLQLDALKDKDPAGAAAAARVALAHLTRPAFAEYRSRFFADYILDHAMAEGQAGVDKLAAEALASKESSSGVFLALGRAYAKEGADAATGVKLLSRGLELYEAAKDTRPEVGDELRYELGRAYVRAGDAAKGVVLLEAVKPGASYGPASMAASAAYVKLGNKAKALDSMVRAVAIEPSPERLASLKRLATEANRPTAEVEAAVWAVRDATSKSGTDFTLKQLDGGEISLAGNRGKVVLVNFWFPG